MSMRCCAIYTLFVYQPSSCASLCRPHAVHAILGKPFTRTRIKTNKQRGVTSGLRRETFGISPAAPDPDSRGCAMARGEVT
jgi:hypothetical protein